MKVFEVLNSKKVEVEPEAPSMFLSRQAGPVLSKYERAVIKRKVAKGYIPNMLKKQAESIER